VKPSHLPVATTSVFHQLAEGWKYVAGSTPIRTILLLFAAVSLMGWPFIVLMPIFALQVLKGGPHMFGFLMGAVGVGALVSAYSLAVRSTVRGINANHSDFRRTFSAPDSSSSASHEIIGSHSPCSQSADSE